MAWSTMLCAIWSHGNKEISSPRRKGLADPQTNMWQMNFCKISTCLLFYSSMVRQPFKNTCFSGPNIVCKYRSLTEKIEAPPAFPYLPAITLFPLSLENSLFAAGQLKFKIFSWNSLILIASAFQLQMKDVGHIRSLPQKSSVWITICSLTSL